MNMTQTYHNKATFTNQFRHSFGGILAAFLRKHTHVFQSLTRGGTPYGGNILRPAHTRPVAPTPAESSSHHQIAQLQQQLNDLSQIISQLGDQVNKQTSGQRANSAEQIGLNRFRALKTAGH